MSAKEKIIDIDFIREFLHYDPISGVFIWIKKRSVCVHVGERAGTIDGRGYRKISLKFKGYLEHRLAWLLMTGHWPDQGIDHINNNPGDNRWANLRAATPSQNSMNSRIHRDNACGLKGTNWHKSTGQWRSSIKVNGRIHHLGFFKTKECAHAAYAKAAIEHYGAFARF